MAHLKPRSTTVVLYQGDDMDRLAELKRRADIAERVAGQKTGTERMGDDDTSVADAQNAFDAFVDEAAERALSVVLHGIGRRRFVDLLLEHPPRQVTMERALGEPEAAVVDGPEMTDHEDDAPLGVNVETFPMALMTYRDGDTVTLAEPEFSSVAEVRRFLDDEIAEGDFEQLWTAAYWLNRSRSVDPKALVYTVGSRSTEQT